MEGVSAGTEDVIDGGARELDLGGRPVRLHVHLLRVGQVGRLVVAVHLEVFNLRGDAGLTVSGEAHVALQSYLSRVARPRSDAPAQTRSQTNDVGLVPDQRNRLIHDDRVDGLPAARGRDVDDGARPADGHGLLEAAHLQGHVYARDETDRELHVLADQALKALKLDL